MPRQDKVFVCFQKAEDDTHKLYIYDDVTAYGTFNWSTWSYEESETSAKYFQEQLAAIPDTATIELHINSNGGSVKEGVAIYSQLKQKNCKKVGYVDGVAYSVAFLILQACDERVMGLGTSALIHNMWMSVDGNAKELRKAADDLDTLMESNRQIFLEKSNLEEQQLIDMMETETLNPVLKVKNDILRKYGEKDEKGKIVMDEDGRIRITDIPGYNTEITTLMNTETDVNVERFSEEEFKKMNATPNQLMTLLEIAK